jgi:hypothetical protein
LLLWNPTIHDHVYKIPALGHVHNSDCDIGGSFALWCFAGSCINWLGFVVET